LKTDVQIINGHYDMTCKCIYNSGNCG